MTGLGKTRVILFAVLALALAGASAAPAFQLNVDAFIDGRSLLFIWGQSTQWHNLTYTVPGKHDGHNDPTKYDSVNGLINWYPNWTQNSGDTWSDTYTSLNFILPAAEQTVTIVTKTARGSLTIYQQPLSANGYKLGLDFNDEGPIGAAWYSVTLNIPQVVPLPGTLALLGSGLMALLWRRRRRG